MIISKDLFIFGEQIFATIIPEGAGIHTATAAVELTTTTTPATPATPTATALITTTNITTTTAAAAATTTDITTTTNTPATTTTTTTTAAGTNEQLVSVDLLKTTGSATTTTTAPHIKQETVALAPPPPPTTLTTTTTTTATATAKKEKIHKIPKEIGEKETKKNKVRQQQQFEKTNSEIAGNKTNERTTTTTTTTTITKSDEKQRRKADVETQEAVMINEKTLAELEKEPLVQRNFVSMTTATAAAPAEAQNFALKQQATLQQQQQQQQQLYQTSHIADCSVQQQQQHSLYVAADLSLNMDKVKEDTSSDHATVTFPFIIEQQRTLQLTFENLSVMHKERQILADINGLVNPGEVLAIMGPSGSGKTTLLDCLSGQRRIDTGSIHLNRDALSKKWRRKICYVLQEEVFFSGLTLFETVWYTALLRLPEKMPKVEKMKLVDRILTALELNFCQHTKFGDYMNRGLSGGEKKRANIACELLTNPLLMLLDEPTSGLDSHTAISLMRVLKRYAMQEQKTVVITVHQPSSQMFHMFDKLLLLYNGRTAYFGEVNNIYRYFENIGVAIKPHYNPADFILEQLKSYPVIREKLFVAAKESHSNYLNRNCLTVNTNNQHHGQILHENGRDTNTNVTNININKTTTDAVVVSSDKAHQHDTLINDIIQHYYKNKHNQHAMLLIDDNHQPCEDASQQLWCAAADSQSNFSSTSSDCQPYESTTDWLDYPTRFHTQFCVLSSRNFKEAKPRMLSKLNWFQTIGLALMAGAIWFQIPRTEEFLHDLQGWMFFSQTYWMLFALFGALNSFPSEREVISKERRSGAYRLSAYYLAKMCGELPLVVTLPTVYLLISYPMLGCSSLKLFCLMLVFLLLNTIVAQSVGFFIGACCMDMNVSITLSALYTLATQLFGGYLSSRIPEALSWVRYTSMIHYAYQNMQILEFREGPALRCGNPSSYEICKNHTTTFIPYEEILKAQNSTSPLWLNTVVLMLFFLIFRGLGYAVLRYVRCPKM